MGHEFAEDMRVRDRDVVVQRVDGGDMDRPGCEEAGDKVNIPRGVGGRGQ